MKFYVQFFSHMYLRVIDEKGAVFASMAFEKDRTLTSINIDYYPDVLASLAKFLAKVNQAYINVKIQKGLSDHGKDMYLLDAYRSMFRPCDRPDYDNKYRILEAVTGEIL